MRRRGRSLETRLRRAGPDASVVDVPKSSPFTAEGQRVAETSCPVNGKHVACPLQKSRGTFFCIWCGAVPMDSVLATVDDQEGIDMGKGKDDKGGKKWVEAPCPAACENGWNTKTKQTCGTCKGTGKVGAWM